MPYQLLIINPGSTSTKVSVFRDHDEIAKVNITHSAEELSRFTGVLDQLDFRVEKVDQFLRDNGLSIYDFQAIVARGGLLHPIPSGTYEVDVQMIADLQLERYGVHAANLGAMIGLNFAKIAEIPAFIVDPVVVDELDDVARVTGRPEFDRVSIFHALNQKAVAKRYAKKVGKPYEELNLIVAHMGGGVSIGCHKQGRIVEVNNALDGEGPMSPERTGTVQSREFIELIEREKWTKKEVIKAIAGQGGVLAHLGTTDIREVERRISEGDQKAKLVLDGMLYQIARYIGAASVVVKGKVDQIILTGGIAYSQEVVRQLTEYTEFLAPVTVYPGEDEMRALAEGAMRVLTGEEEAKKYLSVAK